MKRMLKGKACSIIAMLSKGTLSPHLIQVDGKLSSRILSYVSKGIGLLIVNSWTRLIRVQPTRVIFNTFQGVYCCNPKGITEHLIKNHPQELDIIWVVLDEVNNDVPEGVKTVVAGTFDFFYYLASSKIVVENTIGLQRMLYRKKNNQILYQTWHGSLGIKRLDGPIVNGRGWRLRRWLANKETDYCLSNSSFETEVFRNTYWPDVKVLTYGHARNDTLFSRDDNVVNPITNELKHRLGIEGKKTVLMAPSHYDGKNNPFYNYNFSEITKAFSSRFGGEWVVLFRLHPRYVSTKLDKSIDETDGVVNVTSVYDMQDLLLIADAGITDFSSWIFDYLLTFKPGFILHQDMDFINNERGLYFPFDSTPFPIASNVDELLSNIDSFNNEVYCEKVRFFLDEKGCIDDGKASHRIANHIMTKASDEHL